jgi:O-antigen/teichoic acid export membrane protein
VSASRRRLLIANVDQVVSSGCSYALVMLVARGSSPQDFGMFVIAFGVAMLTVAVCRASFGAVIGMDTGRIPVGALHDLEARSAGAVVVIGGAVGVGLVVLGVLMDASTTTAVVVLGCALPMVLVQDFARYSLVARGQPGRPLIGDLVWLLPTLSLLIVDLLRDGASGPGAAAAVWAAGLVGSMLSLAVRRALPHPVITGVMSWVSHDRRRIHLGTDATFSGLAPVGNGILAAAVAGSQATAAVRGAAAVFAPAATLALAVSLIAVPEARRRDRSQAFPFLWRATWLLAGLTCVWALIAWQLPDAAGEAILGETWSLAHPIVPLIGIEFVGLAVWTGATAMLRYSDATRTALRVRLWYAPASLLLPVLALQLSGVRAFAATLAALGVLVAVVGLSLGVRMMRRTT